MKGDKLVIREEHVKAARQIAELLLPQIAGMEGKFVITIAGESGSGKSETASALSGLLSEKGIASAILQQDDYFVYPPRTNAAMRRRDIGHVGTSEVRLTLLDENLREVLEGRNDIEKPLVFFDEDEITTETVELQGIKVVIVEGTYTTLLKNVHRRVFIDRTYVDTREARKRRERDEQDEFLETVLQIEHGIISSHRPRADIIVSRDYEARSNEAKDRQ